jgi:plasmid maintenance system antidote protein VapI
MIKQKQISTLVNIDQSEVSRILGGKRKISWPLAQRLSEMFPGKDIVGWKNASPEEFKRAFAQYQTTEEVE